MAVLGWDDGKRFPPGIAAVRKDPFPQKRGYPLDVVHHLFRVLEYVAVDALQYVLVLRGLHTEGAVDMPFAVRRRFGYIPVNRKM